MNYPLPKSIENECRVVIPEYIAVPEFNAETYELAGAPSTLSNFDGNEISSIGLALEVMVSAGALAIAQYLVNNLSKQNSRASATGFLTSENKKKKKKRKV